MGPDLVCNIVTHRITYPTPAPGSSACSSVPFLRGVTVISLPLLPPLGKDCLQGTRSPWYRWHEMPTLVFVPALRDEFGHKLTSVHVEQVCGWELPEATSQLQDCHVCKSC